MDASTETTYMKIPRPIPLWENGAPGAMGTADTDLPTLTPFPPSERLANRAAVVICPGGGYSGLAMDHEGFLVAEWLNSLGINAFLLKYRVSPYRHPVPLGDAQRALRIVRARAAEWNVDPTRIGIMGFSAGGHLASTASTHFDAGSADAEDPIDRASCRPDFSILCYPVITLKPPYAHHGCLENLLGKDATPELVTILSNDEQVTKDTPPAFLFHTSGDSGVPSENSVLYYMALRKVGVPGELHVFEPGEHGVGLAPDHPALKLWPDLCANWLRTRGVIPPAP